MNADQLKRLVRESHERQFNGQDFQQAAWDVSYGFPVTDDELKEIQSMPEPGCECGFCVTADWVN